MLLVFGLDLLTSERRAGLAGHSLQRNREALPQAGDSAVDGGCRAFPHADIMRDLAGNALFGRAAHQPEVLPHYPVFHDLQKRRLLELNGERLPQRAVEDRIAGCVGEVGQHHNVFVGERPGLRSLLP